MKFVKAVWIFDKQTTVEMFEGFDEFDSDIWVAICEDEEHWFGSIVSAKPIPQVGDVMINSMSMTTQEPNLNWESVRQLLLLNEVGPPTYGESELFSGKEAREKALHVSCQCDMITLMNRGCPSTSGGTCPATRLN